jgi:hypothetical protein
MNRDRFDRPDDEIPPERFAGGSSSADWPDPAPEPRHEPDHGETDDETEGPY